MSGATRPSAAHPPAPVAEATPTAPGPAVNQIAIKVVVLAGAEFKASCHGLRHTFASHFLEHGTEVVTIKEFLGHASIASSERYARVSNQKIKQEYLRSMQKILPQSKA